MDREEIRELIVGPIATVPTPFDDRYRVDYGLMAEATERWIEGGLITGRSVLKVAAAMGEGPQLTEEEWAKLLETAVEAAKGRAPIMGAVHYKDTVRTIQDARKAADVGVIGLQVSPPIFNQPSQDDLLRYFGGVSEGIDIGVMIYNTPWLPHGTVYPDTFRKMTDFEYIVAIKWHPPDGVAYEDIFDLADVFSIMDNSANPVECRKRGGRGFLTDGVDAYPAWFLALWDMMLEGRYAEAQAEWDRVMDPLRSFYARVVEKSGSDAKVEKGMSEVMGLPMGPPRPPSVPLTPEEMFELRGLMVGWGWPVPSAAEAAAG
jgi:4-hydroxy-tetrahydrodipicolinate synthase